MSSRRLHYAWVVAAAVFVVLLCAAGVRAAPSVFIVPLEREFGWSRALVSGAVSLNLVLYGLVGPFAVAIMQRFGIRRTILVSLVIIAVGVALTNLMNTPWQLFMFWGVLVGLGTGTTAMVLGATVVHRWFVARRGLVMGLLTASTATGQLIFLPFLAAMVEHHGWRIVSLGIASVVALVVPFVALVVRDHPSDVGLRPYGAPPGEQEQAAPTTNPLVIWPRLDCHVPPTVRLTTQTQGPTDGPIAFGWIIAAHQVGAGAGALSAGMIRTSLATYTPAWVIAGVICMVASLLVLRIGRGSRRVPVTADPA